MNCVQKAAEKRDTPEGPSEDSYEGGTPRNQGVRKMRRSFRIHVSKFFIQIIIKK